jgi:hypothetical protein
MEDKEPFLSRWSRRKLETKQDQAAGAASAPELHAAAPPPAPAIGQPAPESELPATPEYREFFDPRVDEQLRRTALKRLFNEPQFNVMDGLDTYIDDYSKPDPIPEAMLRQLNQAKDLLLFDDEKNLDGGASNEAIAADELAPASPAALADPSAPANAKAAGVPGGEAAPGINATPQLEGNRNGGRNG